MPRKTPELDLDFNIFVDPSCLSAPMDDETPATMPPSSEEVQSSAAVPQTPDEPVAQVVADDAEQIAEDSTAAEEAQQPEPEATLGNETSAEEQPEYANTEEEPAIEQREDTSTVEPPADELSAPGDDEAAEAVPAEEDSPVTEDISVLEADNAEVEATAEPETDGPEPEAETEIEAGPVDEHTPETELAEERISDEYVPEPEGEAATEEVQEPVADELSREEEELEVRGEEEATGTSESGEINAVDELEKATDAATQKVDAASEVPRQEATPAEDVGDVDVSMVESDMDEEERGHQPNLGERKTSLRTEALIQAAARAVVAKVEKQKSGDPPQEGDEADISLVSTDSHDTYVLGEDAQSRANVDSPSRRQSSESEARHIPSRSISSDDAGDSSSHNGRDDDVFSDRSARSSLYSLDQHDIGDIPSIKTPQAKESFSRRDSYASSQGHDHSSARTASNFSAISGLSQYDDPKLTFMPTHRETRMPFRTPSEIRAMQMTSPTPSVFNGSSPSRSSAHKNHSHHYQSPRNSNGPAAPSSISRLGSPTVSAQYSPKGRSTPPRFKSARKEAPLVLLHVTLLPLRWVWGDVLNTLDSVLQPPAKTAGTGAGAGTGARTEDGAEAPASSSAAALEPSDSLKTLRDAWRELQDRVGDTVLERGILLPHPQNDYEVLEERLLEALELPLKRRARILECGHYVGPANVPDDGESDDEGLERGEGKMHWCGTCCGEIRCEDLGVGRVFRVKVYASNGLMRAGAWEACWKEMERVDVEVEPIVDVAVQNELEKLAVLQMELEEQRRRELDMERMPEPEPERKPNPDSRAASRQQVDLASEAEMDAQRGMMSSPAPSALQLAMRAATPQPSASNTLVRAGTPSAYGVDSSEERRLRDEERMREIYGDMPSTTSAAQPQQPADQHQQQQPQQQQSPPQQHHTHYPPPQQEQQQQHALPPPLPMLTDGSSRHQDPYRRPAVVLDENAGFVDLLTQAFKVLLRDPKNVAIILLCVFLVVMVKRPGMDPGTGVAEVQVVPPQVVQVPASGQGYRYEEGLGLEAGKVQGVGAVPAVGGGAGVGKEREREVEGGMLASSRLPEVAGLEGGVVAAAELEGKEAVAVGEAVKQQEPVVEEQEPAVGEVPVVVEAEVDQQQVVLETRDEDAAGAQEVAEPEVRQFPSFKLPTDMCPPRGPEYPVTLVGERPAPAEVSEDREDEAKAVTGQEESAAECGADNDSEGEDALPAPTSTFLPGPFVTERTTVRVFETVTQTVRVSVVTQTETVSTVVTAIPQTVEETVFETETVRITVSVPVEEQQKKAKAKPTKGCQEKGGGGGGGGWF